MGSLLEATCNAFVVWTAAVVNLILYLALSVTCSNSGYGRFFLFVILHPIKSWKP